MVNRVNLISINGFYLNSTYDIEAAWLRKGIAETSLHRINLENYSSQKNKMNFFEQKIQNCNIFENCQNLPKQRHLYAMPWYGYGNFQNYSSLF